MRIGGFVKQSLIDWDGYIAAVVFTKGCNLRCFYCHNPSLALPQLVDSLPDIPEETVFGFLRGREAFLDGVVVTGGEPTLQPDLKNFLRNVKELNLFVKLDTNGTNPEILREILAEGLADSVAMDIKHIPEYVRYAEISKGLGTREFSNIEESIEILRASSVPHIFRTTLVGCAHSSADVSRLKKMFPNIVFQDYRGGIPTVETELLRLKL